MDDLLQLFDSSGFMARGQCGQWTESLKVAHVVSNATITLAYSVISVSLFRLWRSHRDVLGSQWMLVGFASFIAACGLTHLSDVGVFWWPVYRFYTILDVMTAVLSIGVAIGLPSVVRHLVRLPTIGEFCRINEELVQTCAMKDSALANMDILNKILRHKVDCLEKLRQTGVWAEAQESTLNELRSLLNDASHQAEPS